MFFSDNTKAAFTLIWLFWKCVQLTLYSTRFIQASTVRVDRVLVGVCWRVVDVVGFRWMTTMFHWRQIAFFGDTIQSTGFHSDLLVSTNHLIVVSHIPSGPTEPHCDNASYLAATCAFTFLAECRWLLWVPHMLHVCVCVCWWCVEWWMVDSQLYSSQQQLDDDEMPVFAPH